jgi:LAO/AO transport system kinase
MWAMLEERLLARLHSDPKVRARLPALERAVGDGALSPTLAVEEVAGLLGL